MEENDEEGGVEMEGIVTRQNWEDVKAGNSNSLNFIKEKQLRHLFGDDYEECIERLIIFRRQTQAEWEEDNAGIGEEL